MRRSQLRITDKFQKSYDLRKILYELWWKDKIYRGSCYELNKIAVKIKIHTYDTVWWKMLPKIGRMNFSYFNQGSTKANPSPYAREAMSYINGRKIENRRLYDRLDTYLSQKLDITSSVFEKHKISSSLV